MDLVEEGGGGLVEEGVAPVWGEGGEGDEDEVAQVHAGMGQGEVGGVEHDVVDGYDVDVYEAVAIASCRVAVGEWTAMTASRTSAGAKSEAMSMRTPTLTNGLGDSKPHGGVSMGSETAMRPGRATDKAATARSMAEWRWPMLDPMLRCMVKTRVRGSS